ncbi:Protein of unknown function, partial [Gryllus bimaculatus]
GGRPSRRRPRASSHKEYRLLADGTSGEARGGQLSIQQSCAVYRCLLWHEVQSYPLQGGLFPPIQITLQLR